jgi:hypothetical protein
MMDRALALTPPPPPRALTAGAREITDSYGKMRRWMGFFFLGHGGIMTTVFSWGLPVDIALDLDGATVDARITGVDHDTSVKLNKKRATKITYAYTAGGEPHEGSFHTIDPKLTTSIVGARLPLEVWPTLPSWSRAKGQRNCFFGYFGLLLALEPLARFPGLGPPAELVSLLGDRQADARISVGSANVQIGVLGDEALHAHRPRVLARDEREPLQHDAERDRRRLAARSHEVPSIRRGDDHRG